MKTPDWADLFAPEKVHHDMVNAFTCCNSDERLRLIFTVLLMIIQRLDHIEQQTKPAQKP